MSLENNFWGPAMWTIMYTVAYTFSTLENIEQVYAFYESLGFLLPCDKCRKHYMEYLAKNPIKAFTSENTNNRVLCQWVYNLEAQVAKKNNRPIETFDVKFQKLQHRDPTTAPKPKRNPRVKPQARSKKSANISKSTGQRFGIKQQTITPGWSIAPCAACNNKKKQR